jgi:hypothetical protein
MMAVYLVDWRVALKVVLMVDRKKAALMAEMKAVMMVVMKVVMKGEMRAAL